MAILQHIQLILSNDTDLPRYWNIGGTATNTPLLSTTSTQAYVGQSGEGDGTNNYIGSNNEEPLSYIGQSGEGAATEQELLTAAEIEKLNQSLYASPFKTNKIRLYTSRVEQLVEKFAYYQQTATGLYEKKLLDFLPHYDTSNPKVIVELTEEDMGVITLDVTRKFEVMVLPRTLLIMDLYYETSDITHSLPGFHFPQVEHDFLDPDDDQEKEGEQKEIDLKEVELFVRTYFKYAHAYREKNNVPELFSLAEAAMIGGYSVDRPGENLFEKAATSKWKKETVTVEKEVTGPKQTIRGKIVGKLGKNKFLVKKHLRAYPSLVDSFSDHYQHLQKDERFREVFHFSRMPYSFAGALAEAEYSNSEQFLSNIEQVMEIIEPFVLAQQRSLFLEKEASTERELAFLAAASVLAFVLVSFVVKPL